MVTFLALRNLRSRLVRTLLTATGIIIGVGVILAISITNESTLASVESVFTEASGKAQLVVSGSSASAQGFDSALLDRLRQVEGINFVVPSLDVTTLLASRAAAWQVQFGITGGATAGSNFHLFGIDPALDPRARAFKLSAGRFLDSRDKRSVVLVDDYARENKISLGQELRVLTPQGDTQLKVIGLITKQGPGRINDGATGFVPLGQLQELFERGSDITQADLVLDGHIAGDAALLEQKRIQVESRLGQNLSVVYPAARGQIVTQLLSTYQQGLAFGSTIALFVGAFLIYNTFAMTVIERTRELGMLRALGMTRRQVTALLLQEALLLGILGSLLGLILGALLSRALISGLTGVIGSQINEIVIPPAGVVSALAVGIVITLAAALLPARNASRISPIEALRVRAQSDESGFLVRRGWLPGLGLVALALATFYLIPFRPSVSFRMGQAAIFLLLIGAALIVPGVIGFFQRLLEPLAGALFGGPGLLGASNISRARGRTATTVGALMVGIAMVIAQGALQTSFSRDLLTWVETAVGADLYIRSPVGMREDLGKRLLAVDGISEVSPVTYSSIKLGAALRDPGKSDTLIFIGVDPASYTRVASFQFATSTRDHAAAISRLAAGDAVFLSTTVADKYHLAQGQSIPLVTARGEQDFIIAGLIVDFTGQGFTVTGSRQDLTRYLGLNSVANYLVRLNPSVLACSRASPQAVHAAVGCRDEAAVRADVESRFQSRHLKVESSSEFRSRILGLANQAFSLLNVLTLIGIIVAALGVINTLTMNVLERTREIGGLRAIGMTMLQIARMILAEALLVGIIGGLFGLGFGYILSRLFLQGLNQEGGYRVEYVFPLGAMLLGAVIALLVSELAALYPAWRAARVGILQAIQHE